jgi:hypothetical protein
LLEHPETPESDVQTIAQRTERRPRIVNAILWINEHRLLPEAWCSGFLQTYTGTLRRPSYLNGERSWTGWWYYFPLAFLYKSPIATLATLLLAILLYRRGRGSIGGQRCVWRSLLRSMDSAH